MPGTTRLRVEIGAGLRILWCTFVRVYSRGSWHTGGAAEVVPMKKPFDALYAGMEGLGPQLRGADRYVRGIGLIRERIAEMQGRSWIICLRTPQSKGLCERCMPMIRWEGV